uniref:Uncharacterized protein n=1 Tax=Cacopsylla melanoneura TaxID=428564 RepID=A0A8D8WNG7_9HEMI
MVVWSLYKMSPERSWTGLGAQLLAESMSPSVLSFISSRGPRFFPSHHWTAGLGCHLLYHGRGCGPRWPTVQYSSLEYLRPFGWMAVSDVHNASPGGDAPRGYYL